MSLRSFFLPDMPPAKVTYDWNGATIDFSAWADDAYGVYEYETRSRRYHFKFNLVPVESGEVRIYILDQPDYGGRATDGHSTHRIGHHPTAYVCIAGHLAPRTVPHALTWAVYWAEQTEQYIRTGRAFS